MNTRQNAKAAQSITERIVAHFEISEVDLAEEATGLRLVRKHWDDLGRHLRREAFAANEALKIIQRLDPGLRTRREYLVQHGLAMAAKELVETAMFNKN